MSLLFYILKVFTCSAILFGYYWFFLRNKRVHHYNRFYLLCALLLSILLPFIKINVFDQPENGITHVVFTPTEVLTVNSLAARTTGSTGNQYFTWFYTTK